MTDALATLRAGCQKGEMPLFDELLRTGVQRLTDAVTEPPFIDLWDEEACLDALAALQEALWPGSLMGHALKWWDEKWWSFVRLWPGDLDDPDDERKIADSGLCPTLACAWLDAILAGLQQEKDDG